MTKTALPLAVLLFSGACSPVRPGAVLAVDPQLLPVWNRMASVPAPWAGGVSLQDWARSTPVQSVVIRVINHDYGAQYDGSRREIAFNPVYLQQIPLDEAVGMMAHEFRHAEGYRHECDGGYNDLRFGSGAWTIHILTLENLGRQASASYLRGTVFCQDVRPQNTLLDNPSRHH